VVAPNSTEKTATAAATNEMSGMSPSAQLAAIARAFASPVGSLPHVLSPENAAARQNHRLANGCFQNM
jgi:hypothetical protein